MNVFLWILQAVLAALFLAGGAMKAIQLREKLAERMPWVEDFSGPVVRFIGIAEVAGAVGLILPAALDIAPVLTPIAATGLAVTMLLAIVVHVRRKEPQAYPINAVLLVAAAVVAWGRFGPYSF